MSTPAQRPNLILVPRDQFSRLDANLRRVARIGEILLATAVVGGVGGAALVWAPPLIDTSGLLAAVSIVTGICFSMAITFWSRSLDARKTEGLATDRDALTMLDTMRTQLIWTVAVGVVSAILCVAYQLFLSRAAHLSMVPRVGTALIGGVTVYLFVMVLSALGKFQQAFYVLRQH